MSIILVIILFLGLQPGTKNARANELYRQGKFDEALAIYNSALEEAGETPALHYNRGNALYRKEQYPIALQAYTNALESNPPLNGNAYYNMGNSLYRMGRLEASIEAYKQGLQVRADDNDMKYNLEYVTRQLQKQQNEEDKQEQQNEEDKQEQQNEEDKQDEQNAPDEDNESENQPTPQEGELSKEEAERLLNALNRDEHDIQKKLRRQRATELNPEKNW
tara:strand:+ start:814 stop:1473 length:660 start_codon:yes stop_codon:yes gene_type:complete